MMKLHARLRRRRKILAEKWRQHLKRQPQFVQFFAPYLVALALLLMAAAIAAPFLAKPALAEYRSWQDERMLAAAEGDLQSGLPAVARDKALHLLRGGRLEKHALPLLVRAADGTGDPKRCDYAQMLLMKPQAASADRLFGWQILCRSSSAWRVVYFWTKLGAEERSEPEFAVAYLDRLLDEDLPAEADACLQTFPSPLPRELAQRDLRRLAGMKDDASWREFQEHLVDRVEREPEDASLWLEWLDAIPQANITLTSATALRPYLSGAEDPLAKLRAERLEMAAQPAEAERIFAETVRLLAGPAPKETAEFCLWVDRPREALEVLVNVDLREDAAGFLLACRAAEQAGETARWAELLEEPPPGPGLALALCDRIHVNGKLGQGKTRASDEAAAIAAAMAQPEDDALHQLARQAEERGLDEFARRIWLEAIRTKTSRLPMAKRIESLIRESAESGSEEDLNLVLSAYRSAEPGNLVIHVQHRYLQLISGRIPAATLAKEFEGLLKRFPEMAVVRNSLVLALLMDGRESTALRVATEGGRSSSRTGDAYDAIHAVCLSANGRQVEAGQLWNSLRWDTYLPSEKTLFRKQWNRFNETAGESETEEVLMRE